MRRVRANLKRLWVAAWLLLALLPAASSHAAEVALPVAVTDSAAALVHDLTYLVSARMQREWEIDAVELQALRGAALESVCRTAAPDRDEARRRLVALRASAGGSLDAALEAAGGDLREVAPLLLTDRALALLDAASEGLADCPRWMRPHQRFLGRQTTAGRWVLRLDGGGLGTLRHSEAGAQFGGGGSGRVLLGWGGSGRWSVFWGPELGGGALLRNDDGGALAVVVSGAAPVVLRWTRLQWHVDVDLSPVGQWRTNGDFRGMGGRVGTLIAVGTGRLLGALPWAGVGVNIERMWTGTAGADGEWTLRAGLRVGFDWDFGAASRDRAAWRAFHSAR